MWVAVDTLSRGALHKLDPRGSPVLSRVKRAVDPVEKASFPQRPAPCFGDGSEKKEDLPWN
jgi:hypothetical protein